MKLKLHHVNLSSRNVAGMEAFYSGVLGLQPKPANNDLRVTNEGYSGAVAFLSDGDMEMHLAEQDLEICFKTGKGVNPLDRGHIAFRTDDIAAVKAELDAKGIPFADFGDWAMQGWQQIFFYDPDGNVVEVHQVENSTDG